MTRRFLALAVCALAAAGTLTACSSKATAAPTAPTGRAAASPAPSDGGTFPDADAILARLAAAGLACTSPSPVDGASAFFPGATSMTGCDSPGGKAGDTSVEVFDTAAHLAAYQTSLAADITDPTGIVTGTDWALDSTNTTYLRKVQQALGGRYAPLTAPTAGGGASSGAAALLASAGPLRAHLDGNRVVCDQDTASWSPDGHGGVEVQAHLAGSGLMDITASSKDGAADTSQEYTKGTREGSGHEFDLAGLAPGNVNEIDFSVTSAAGAGSCQVEPLSK